MMDKQTLNGLWDLMRQRHGVTLRLIESLPEDKLHSHPVPGMRSPAELIVHLYNVQIDEIPRGVLNGAIKADESAEKATAASHKTKADLLRYVGKSWESGNQAVDAITDKQLSATVSTPWGFSGPGWMMMGISSDEYLHHRGQLFAFARLMGVVPPMIWDFEHNAEQFRPR
jgi:uncharacterized damage-inducible protein DinB